MIPPSAKETGEKMKSPAPPGRTCLRWRLGGTAMAQRICLCVLFILVFCLCARTPASAEEGDWAVTLYGARLNTYSLGETLTFQAHYEDSYLAVVAVSWNAFSLGRYADIELEGQVAKHFGGGQDNWELNGLPVFRWRYFPWNAYLNTSIAAGAGLSWALGVPYLEEVSGEPPGGRHHSSRLTGYGLIEIAFSLPQWPKWSFVARVHHRSSAGGLIGNSMDASNAIGFGIRYVFH